MMNGSELLAPFERLLAEHYAPEALREMLGDEARSRSAFAAMEQSGFLEVMRAEADGGAGLSLLASEPLLRAIGHHAAPASIATAMAERGSGNGATQELSAVLQSILIAGALEKLLMICTDYANMREQFGKPIGKQQAIQHQLALLAEQCALVRVAAQYGCANGFDISPERAAIAKCAASAAVPLATSIAHAIHGAIGITAEYDLHLWTERLYEWRAVAGSESYWASKMGAARLAQAGQTSVEFLTDI